MSQQVPARVCFKIYSLSFSSYLSFVSRSCALLKAIMTNYSRLNRSRNYDELYFPSERMWEREKERERGAEGNVLSCWNGVWLVKGFWVRLWQINCHLLLSHFPGMSEPIMALLSRGEIKHPITASDLLSLLSNIPTQGGELRLW